GERPLTRATALLPPTVADLDAIQNFAVETERRIHGWLHTIDRLKYERQKAVIWGSGSKGVSFLSALEAHVDDGRIEYAVDINPFRKGYFMPGTGQEIVAPTFLTAYQPEVVIAMNSIYATEITLDLTRVGVRAAVLPIEAVETAV